MAKRGEAELAAVLRRFLQDEDNYSYLGTDWLTLDGKAYALTEEEQQIVQEVLGNG